ncbi:uncharacterized protein LOC135143812 [Zophobas morio]|uniref:uncharacterized protein LOC135143812 n=1 Tax=Zophobas morio TaxID=2755281 RepID=UPI00308348D8
MSVSNVQRILTDSIPKIADVVQDVIYWPERMAIKTAMPIAFRARYRQTESIIDCLEIQIEKPTDSLKQALTWSEYKKCNTLKYLISSTPNGFVNFISGGYGGRTSDKDILKKSGYLNCLPDGASVIADRGFKHVTPMLTAKNCILIRPPSVSEGKKLSKVEMKKNKTIAALRVHVERVIKKLREFTMLGPHACIHHSLLYLMNHIIIIACAIINVQGKLIKC